MHRNSLVTVITAVTLAAACAAAQAAPPTKLVNAASIAYGARASMTVGPGVVKDRQTTPANLLDGNAHTRCVVTGTPYTITVELPFKVPVDHLSFAQSDYATEAAPKDLDITFDDGQALHPTLELKRSAPRRPAWQDVPVGRDVQRFTVTVRSNYDGQVKWGGLADIAVWTSADLDAKFHVPGYDAAAPVFVHAPASGGAASAPAVTAHLPAAAKPGEHPCLILTPDELKALRDSLPQSPRGREALKNLMNVADGAAATTPDFPDPKGPGAQLNDRSDTLAERHSALSKHAGALGVAYALTGDMKYARAAAAILTGYARLYPDYPEHRGANKNDTSKVMAQRLSEAMWLIPQLEAYDYIHDSGALSAADKTLIEQQLFHAAVVLIRRQEPAAEAAARDAHSKDWRTTTVTTGGIANNWLTFYNSATMMTGALLHDQNMLDLAAADFRSLVARGVTPDGLWDEGAIGYQMFALGSIVPGFETAAHQGIDLWGFDNGRLKQLFDSPLRYAYPDNTMPGIHDSTRARLGDWSTMTYDYAYLRYGDPHYAALINISPRQLFPSDDVYVPTRLYQPLPEPPPVATGTTLFGSLGYGILRDANKYALMDYGPHGGVHGHYDKLNLILYGRGDTGLGDELGGEPVFHRYEDPLHDEWTVQTVAHNTMTVDERSQAATEGKLLLFESTPTIKVMRAESAGSYPGAVLDRTVLVTPDAVIDLYYGVSPFARTWDRTFRYQGKLAQMPAAAGAGPPLGATDGYQHIQVLRRQPATELWQGTWQTKAGDFNVALAGAPGQQLILGLGPDKDEMALARQSGTTADFGAIYTLAGWHNPVRTAQWVAAANGLAVLQMTQQDGTETFVMVAHVPGPWQAAGWQSDARVLFVRRHGTALQVLIGGGTFAHGDGAEIRQPAPGHYLAEPRDGKLQVVAAWTPGP